MNCQIRISRSYDEVKELVTDIEKISQQMVVYQHDSDEDVNRTHIHIYAYEVSLSEDTIRNRIKKVIIEKLDWSFSKTYGKRPDIRRIDMGAISYGSKGKYDPVLVKGISDEIIKQKKTEGYDVKKDKLTVKNGKIVIIKGEQEKKKTDMEMIRDIAARVDTNKITENIDIANEIIATWKRNNKRGHQRILMEWIDAVKIYSDSSVENWVEGAVAKYESLSRVRF